MADGLNYCAIAGNLGQDPELRVTQGGTAVMTMSIGCNQSYLNRNRVRQERVEWIRCVVWGKRAEALHKFLRKGAWVFVEGRLQNSSWEDREGIKRYKTEVVAEKVLLGGSNNPRNKNKQRDPENRANRRDEDDFNGGGQDDSSYDGGGGYADGSGDDDIPF